MFYALQEKSGVDANGMNKGGSSHLHVFDTKAERDMWVASGDHRRALPSAAWPVRTASRKRRIARVEREDCPFATYHGWYTPVHLIQASPMGSTTHQPNTSVQPRHSHFGCLTTFFFLLSLWVLPGVCHAQDMSHIHLSVSADDPVGQQLAYHLLKSLSRYTVSNSTTGNFILLSLTTFDPHEGQEDAKQATIYGALWLVKWPEDGAAHYLNSVVGYCGSNRVEETAKHLAQVTNDALKEHLEFLRALLEHRTKNNPTSEYSPR